MGQSLKTTLYRLDPRFAPEKPLDSFRNWFVVAISGPYSYTVELEGGKLCKRHIDQLRGQGKLQPSGETKAE
ncbi:hypothetical protein E2320_014865, partial [Naja naja]